MLSLAANYYDVSLRIAADRLQIPAEIVAAEQQLLANQQQINDFWETAKFSYCTTENEEIQRFRWIIQAEKPAPLEWQTGPSAAVGWADIPAVNTMIQSLVPIPTYFRRWAPRPIFNNKRKGKVLLIAHENPPKVICGFLAIKGAGRAAVDREYVSVMPSHTIGGGLVYAEGLFAPAYNRLSNRKFVATDIATATRLHTSHKYQSRQQLPLITCDSSQLPGVAAALQDAGCADVVAFGEDALANIAVAKPIDGFVSDALTRRLRDAHADVDRYLTHISASAVPWRAALRKVLASKTAIEIEHIADKLQLTMAELRELLPANTTIPKLQKCTISTAEDIVVRASADGWWKADRQKISNAIVKITEVLAAKSQSWYVGEILHKSTNYPFRIDADTLDTQGFTWVRKYVREQSGEIIQFNSKWTKRVVELATAFHPPTPQPCCNIVGWNKQTRRIHLGDFSLGVGPVIQDELFVAEWATTRIPRPYGYTREFVSQLSTTSPATSLFWATATVAAYTLLADVTVLPDIRVVLAGEHAGAFCSQLLSCMGSPAISLNTIETSGIDAIRKYDRRLLLAKKVETTAARHDLSRCAYAGDFLTGLGTAVNLPAVVIHSMRPTGSWELWRLAAAMFLPNYLQYVVERKFTVLHQQYPSIETIRKDIAKWFRSIGGSDKAIKNSKYVTITQEHWDALSLFHEITSQLIYQKQLPQCIAAAKRLQQAAKPCVWISPDLAADVLQTRGSVSLDTTTITAQLHTSGAIEKQAAVDGYTGFFVSADWWQAIRQKHHYWRRSMMPKATLVEFDREVAEEQKAEKASASNH